MRDQILSSASQLFIKHGYHGLSMRQIAESVGVTKAALYYHFKDKEDLFLAILEDYLVKLEALIIEIQNEEIPYSEKVNLLVKRILSQPVDQRAVIRLATQEMVHLNAAPRQEFGDVYHARFIGRVQSLLEGGMAAGEFSFIDSKAATWSLLGMMYPYFYPIHSADVSLSDESVDQLVSIFLNGIKIAP